MRALVYALNLISNINRTIIKFYLETRQDNTLAAHDTSGRPVRMWRDVGYKEPAIWIWCMANSKNFTAPRLTVSDAVKVRNTLDNFIKEYGD